MDFYCPLLSSSWKDLICCRTCLIFLKFSWWPVWTLSAQTHLNFQMNLLKVKIRKEHKKIFCGPWKIFKNSSSPINICLKHFMTPAKTLRHPPPLPPLSYSVKSSLGLWSAWLLESCQVRTWWLCLKNRIKNFVKLYDEEISSKAWSMWQDHILPKHFLLKALSNC